MDRKLPSVLPFDTGNAFCLGLWLKQLGNLQPKSCMIIRLQQNKIFCEKSSQFQNLSTLQSWMKLLDLKHLLDFNLKYFFFWTNFFSSAHDYSYSSTDTSLNLEIFFPISKNIFPKLFIYFFLLTKSINFIAINQVLHTLILKTYNW